MQNSKLDNDKWARFYELGTNRPIYVNTNREIVYEFVNIRPGYSWIGEYGIKKNIQLYENVVKVGREKYLSESNEINTLKHRQKRLESLEPKVRKVIDSIDDKGRWIENGYIQCSTFIKNIELLSDYVSLTK